MKKFPIHFWFGLILIAVFWYISWSFDGFRTHLAFFTLWLGYSLTVDGIVFFRKGTSLITRNKFYFVTLFIISIPCWWLFEFFNMFMQNWFYDGRQYFSELEYFLLSSLSFSIVIPAVFEMAELVSTFGWIKNRGIWKPIEPSNRNLFIFTCVGFLLIIGVIALPDYFYPFVWIAVYLMIEPLNVKLNNPNLFSWLRSGDWRPVLSLALGCLITGFFWEFWNFYSYPKWIYDLPWVHFLEIFEMPILGYIGYIPFSWELFAIYNFVIGLFGLKNKKDYPQIS